MIRIDLYENYWQTMQLRLPAIKSIAFINNDKDMGTAIQGIKKEDLPILFVAMPSADGAGSIDNNQERNVALLFLMSKYDAQGKNKAYDILKELQPIFEDIKNKMIDDSADSCNIMSRLEIDSMHSDPEYKLYSDFSGWSLSFIF